MSDPKHALSSDAALAPESSSADNGLGATDASEETSFAQLLKAYEADTATVGPKAGDRRGGKIVSISDEAVLVDVGAKAEGYIPIDQVRTKEGGLEVEPGQEIDVYVEGRDADGNLRLSRVSPEHPRSLEDLQLAHDERIPVWGKVTGLIKGGFTVDVGVRAFMPQSRSGVRDSSEMHKLVGQQIRARVVRAPDKKNVVLDRRSILEQEEREAEAAALERLQEGDVVQGTVKSLATYGAFVDVGGIDALLHISDMSWTRLADPARLLSIGDTVQVKVLKVDRNKRRVSVGLKQLTRDPWEDIPSKYHVGDRVKGTVQRVADFGAFVEVEPGVEGLIHVTELSWSKRVRKPEDVVKVGDVVEAVVLGVNPAERRLSLGLKQALGDPWEDAATRFKEGAVVEGRVRNLQPFGAFVELAEGVDGMIHIADLSENRIKHPNEVVKVGDTVRAMVLEFDKGKRRIRLGLKQLAPTPADEFIKAHQVGDTVTGRVLRAYPGRVELGEGVEASCPSASPPAKRVEEGTLAAKLAAVWKPAQEKQRETEETPKVQLKPGEVRKFRITKLDAEQRGVEVELA